MARKLLRILVILFSFFGVVLMFTITTVDRQHYQQTTFYKEMDQRLDSLAGSEVVIAPDSLQVGWSKINITPQRPQPLAGYGSRDPKVMTGVHDSSYVRTLVFRSGDQKVALITADLLIIHPEISRKVWTLLQPDWSPHEIYFTASHTHSGAGGWAPGFIGKLFAGEYNPLIADNVAQQIAGSVLRAAHYTKPGLISFIEFSMDDLVKNRLVKEKGITDPWLKVLKVQSGAEKGLVSFFSAHATCLGHENRMLSGDYPAKLNQSLEADSSIRFSAFAAGAVGSMAPRISRNDDFEEVRVMADELEKQIALFDMLGATESETGALRSYQLKVPLRAPHFKIAKSLAIRPYLFNTLAGEYETHIRVLQLGSLLFIGLPCDFSGELAVPLYEKAKAKGINLIISSFNGEYIGYIVKDEWYDLPKYESRTMSWYGPDNGAYFSEIITRIIDATPNYQTNAIGR